MRVLVVEDDLLTAGALCAVIQEMGHEVVGLASESECAVALIESVRIELVLLDIGLADGMTGPSVAKAAVDAGVAFVFVTSNLRLLFGRLMGAFGVIAKPYDDNTMRASLDFLAGAIRGAPTRPLPRGLILSLEVIERLGLQFDGPVIVDGTAA